MLIIDMLPNVPLLCCQAQSLGSIDMRDLFISGPETQFSCRLRHLCYRPVPILCGDACGDDDEYQQQGSVGLLSVLFLSLSQLCQEWSEENLKV